MLNTASISLDGSTQYLTAGNFLDNPTDFTVEYWIKTSTGSIGANYVNKISNHGSGTGWATYNSGTDKTIFLLQYGVTDYYFVPTLTTVIDGNWHHIACVKDGTTLILYFDRVDDTGTPTIVGDVFTTGFSNTKSVMLGQDSDHTAIQYGSGLFDEVRLWNVARSQAEIAANWKTSINSAPGLVASWHFNNTLTDSSGNGNNLTGTGSPGYSTDVPYPGTFTSPFPSHFNT